MAKQPNESRPRPGPAPAAKPKPTQQAEDDAGPDDNAVTHGPGGRAVTAMPDLAATTPPVSLDRTTAPDGSELETPEGEPTAGPFDLDKTSAPEPAVPTMHAGGRKVQATVVPGGAQGAKAAGKMATFGDYKLISKLGEGGMGVVYKAHQISLDRDVAIKVLSKALASNATYVERFYREARAMARLDHPNIIRSYEVGQKQGLHYLVAEYIDGGSVQGWLKKLGTFAIGDALHIILACARALEHAHDLKMIHRDVKPDNILLTRKGVVKLADLGLAKATDEDVSLTTTGQGAGTPLYMAPEQARDAKHVDHRTDIYALGIMLYHFLTGAPPFSGNTLLELIEAKEKAKFPPARKTNDEVPERLDLMIDKMIAKNPDHRYQTCAELIQDLEGLELAYEQLSFLHEGEVVMAKPKALAKTVVAPPAAKRPAAKPKAAPPPEEEPEEEEEEQPEEEVFWYIKRIGAAGKMATLKVSQDDLIVLIKAGEADSDTPTDKDRTGPFNSLASYKEFFPFFRSKIAQQKAETKETKLKNLYQKIEEDERWKRRWGWAPKLFAWMTRSTLTMVWIGIVIALAIAVVILLKGGFKWLGNKFEEWWSFIWLAGLVLAPRCVSPTESLDTDNNHSDSR